MQIFILSKLSLLFSVYVSPQFNSVTMATPLTIDVSMDAVSTEQGNAPNAVSKGMLFSTQKG